MSPPRRRRRPSPFFVLGSSLVAVVILGGVVAIVALQRSDAVPRGTSPSGNRERSGPHNDREEARSGNDARSATRPATGHPLDLRYCPQGGQCFLAVRPAGLLSVEPEGPLIRRALGPSWNDALTRWEEATGLPLEAMEDVIITWLADGQGGLQTVVTVHWTGERPDPLRGLPAGSRSLTGRGGASESATDGVWITSDRPAESWVIFGPPAVVAEIQASRGRPPLLRRELETLRRHTSVHDQFTALLVPRFVLQHGKTHWPRLPALLWRNLEAALAETPAALLTAHVTAETLSVETRFASPVETAQRNRQQISAILQRLPGFVDRAFGEPDTIDPYWRTLAARFPAMLQYVTDHTQFTTESRELVATLRLPARAAHNLILATELSLATWSAQAAVPVAVPTRLHSLADLLAAPVTLTFARQSLEDALSDLKSVIQDRLRPPFGIEIVFDGPALQREGITRNQQIVHFHTSQTSVAAVLTELVMRANPDRSVQKPADPNQKLIWVTEPWATNQKIAVIRITTRNGARESEWELPVVFGEP